jgi:hypothetical protein
VRWFSADKYTEVYFRELRRNGSTFFILVFVGCGGLRKKEQPSHIGHQIRVLGKKEELKRGDLAGGNWLQTAILQGVGGQPTECKDQEGSGNRLIPASQRNFNPKPNKTRAQITEITFWLRSPNACEP